MSGSGRSLRPRTSRPSYAQYAEDIVPEGNASAGGASSDDFEPEKEVEDGGRVSSTDEDAEGEIDEDAVGTAELVVSNVKKTGKGTTAPKMKAKSVKSLSASARTVLSAPLSRKRESTTKANLLPNNEHRHRGPPLYRTQHLVERQATPTPDEIEQLGPFVHYQKKPTKNWTYDPSISARFGKSSGNNIGKGPIWEYMEDRSWWKEAYLSPPSSSEDDWTEARRRPRVQGFTVRNHLEYLDEAAALTYLPKEKSSLTCLVGPVGNQQQVELEMFGSLNLRKDHSTGHVFNAGGPVTCLDWCPIFSEDRAVRRYRQYLAVTPLPHRHHNPLIGVKCERPSEACIQIWSLGANEDTNSVETLPAMHAATTRCELVLCIDSGPAQALRWCPLPCNDPWGLKNKDGSVRKLGALGGTFEDGSLSIFVVPDPEDVLLEPNSFTKTSRAYLKIEPAIRIELKETTCWSLDWANSTRLAVGCSNGSVAVYDIDWEVLVSQDDASVVTDLLPSYYVSLHQSAIRSIAWINAAPVSGTGACETINNPTIISSGGYDGWLVFTDLREGNNTSGNAVNRTRDVMNSIAFSHYTVGIIGTDGDNIVKTFSVYPSTLGRGHFIFDSESPVWSLGASDYHAHLAIGCADGSCVTTNTLRSTRRSSSNPFLSYKIFQLDYNRKTDMYRMLDQFLPTEILDHAGSRSKNVDFRTVNSNTNSGAWSANVSVTCVRWNCGGGLTRAPLLASATASGLCRVDWLLGHFARGYVPYGGVKVVRKEFGVDVKFESDEELEEESD